MQVDNVKARGTWNHEERRTTTVRFLVVWLLSLSFPLALHAQTGIVYIAPDSLHATSLVYFMNPDGTYNKPVTANLVGLELPKWSRDAQLIAAEGTPPGANTAPDLYTFDRAGGSLQQITNFAQQAPGYSVETISNAFSQDRKNLVVSALLKNNQGGLITDAIAVLIYSSTGTPGANVLTIGYTAQAPYDYTGLGVDWSPNANLLLVPYGTVYGCPGGIFIDVGEIWSAPPVTNAFQQSPPVASQITNFGNTACANLPTVYRNVFPAFSPNASQVAFVQWVIPVGGSLSSAIFAANVDGSNLRQVIALPGETVFGVSWSGDGSKLAFDRGQAGTNGLWTVNVDGSGLTQILSVTPGSYTNSPSWSWVFPVPQATNTAPTNAVAGGPAFNLTVNGSNFVSSSVVQWNKANLATTFVSSTQLQAVVPPADIAGSEIVRVDVFNPTPSGGTSNTLNFTVNNPVPTVNSLAPSSTQAGGPGFSLTVNGSNFTANSGVQWNGSARTTTYVSSGQLQAAILASDIGTAGTAQVGVANPAPGGAASNALTFTITPPATFALMVTEGGMGSGTVTSNPGRINCPTTCRASFNSGTVVTLTAKAASGSTFAGWSGSCSGTGACSVTMSAAKSVTATFNVVKFTLTVSKAGAGSGTVTSTPSGVTCGGTCRASFNSGTVVTLTAKAASGSNFVGWSGACSGTGACSITMSAAKSVTATFK